MKSVVGIYTDANRRGGVKGYGAIGWYRVINPLSKLGYETLGDVKLGTPQDAINLKKKGDIWFFKEADNDGMNVHIDTAKTFTGAKMVLDLDDDPFSIDERHPLYEFRNDSEAKIARMIAISDHITVSTQHLKEVISKHHPDVTVLPNAIDPEIWKVTKKQRNDGKIRIGWVASGSHLVDTPLINPVFDEILAKYPQVELHLCGFTDKSSSRGDREFHHQGTVGYDTYPQFLADLDLDIAVAPLLDIPFNRSKSNIKWLENAMLETPMVLSDVEPYKCVNHYKNGYLASNHAQWVKYLSWLIENPEKRKEIGKAAKAEALKNYTIDKQLHKYEELFDRIETNPDIIDRNKLKQINER